MTYSNCTRWILAGAIVVASTQFTVAQDNAGADTEVLILQALDQPTSLTLNETPIGKALSQLSANTGIPIELKPDTVDFLPYGPKTSLSAEIADQPLKVSLDALLQPLGLTYRIEKNRVLVRATQALQRITRRATWEELATLGVLARQPWSAELAKTLSFQFPDSPVGGKQANVDELTRRCETVGAGSALDVLDKATQSYGWTWYPEKDYIAVVTKVRQVERQLDTLVSVRYEQISLQDAMLDLAERAGVLLKMDPGVIASLPPQTSQRFSLAIENAKVRQVFEVVAGQTGLGYFVESDGIRLTNNLMSAGDVSMGATGDADAAMQTAVRALRSNSIVGQIMVLSEDGQKFSFFIREDDLPPEVNEMRKFKIKDAVNLMRKTLSAELQKD